MLIDYLRETFNEFRTDRQSLIEEKWERNYEAFYRQDVTDDVNENRNEILDGEDWRSDADIGITRQKCITGHSMIYDIMMQGARFPFELVPGPLQEYIDANSEEQQVSQSRAKMRANDALLRQQLVDCRADRAFRSNCLSMCVYGETYVKRRVIQVPRRGYDEDGQVTMQMFDSPSWEFVSVWDIFRDLGADDLQKGRGVFHRQLLTPHELAQMKGKEFYDDEAIDTVLSQSPANFNEHQDGTLAPGKRDFTRGARMPVLEFWGLAPRVYVDAYMNDEEELEEIPDDHTLLSDMVEISVSFSDRAIVRFAKIQKRPNYRRPFYRSEFEETIDSPASHGVSDNTEAMQKVLTHAIRKYEDNKELSTNVLLAVRERLIDGEIKFRPGEMLRCTEEVEDIRQAIQQFVVQDVGESLINLINLGFQIADEDSMIPKSAQGFTQQGTQTAYEVNQLLNQAGKYIGMVIKNIDQDLIVPIISDFLEFNQNDDNFADDLVDYTVTPLGFSSYQTKTQRSAALNQTLAMLTQLPQLAEWFKMDTLAKDIAYTMDMNADRYVKSQEEYNADLQAQQQSPQAQFEQRMMDLELRMKEAEIRAKEAEAMAKMAQAGQTQMETELEPKKAELDVIKTQADIAEQRAQGGAGGAEAQSGPAQGAGAAEGGAGLQPAQEPQDLG